MYNKNRKVVYTAALLLIFCINTPLRAQNISLNSDKISVKSAMESVKKEYGYSFVFESGDVDTRSIISIDAKNETIEEVVRQILRGQNVSYEIKDKNIIVRKKQQAQRTAQQNKTVTGTVVDNAGLPMPFVSIVVRGSSQAITTDVEGKFSMSIPADATLEVSYIGYQTQAIGTANKTELNIIMTQDTQSLDEVVVVGYGTMRKKDLTGSVVQVRPDRIANENPKTVQDILRGTPGLRVGYDASAKGGGSMILRGQRSVYDAGGHNNPLLILDGMIFYGELSEINPDDIAQIDILKDASAAAIYGAKAASGVIIIVTQKGKKGKPTVNFSANVGWTEQSIYRKRFTPEDYIQHRQDWYTKNTYGINPVTGAYEAYQSGAYADKPGYFMNPDKLPDGVSIDDWRAYSTTHQPDESNMSIWAQRLGFRENALANFLAGKTVDWAKHSFRTGFNQDYNASISGAGDRINYYLSIGYLKNQGAKLSDEYRAVRSNIKLEAQVNKWFEVGANINFQDRSDGSIDQDLDQSLRNSPYSDYADENGNPVQYPLSLYYNQRGYNYDFLKQYLELEKGYTVFNGILNAKVKLPFNITYSFNASPRYQFFYDRYFMSASLPNSVPTERGANREQAKRFDWSLNNTITWDYTFAAKHHTILTLVQEAEERQSWLDRIEARNILPSDALGFHNTKNGSKENSTYNSSDSHQTADALLARLFYSFDNRYMLTASIRRDGYSAFGSSNPYAAFPSVAVAWSFANEDFFRWNNIMNAGKLRISYGKNGNRQLDNPYLALANLYEGAGKMQGYILPDGNLSLTRYLMAERLANPFLQWEKTTSWNFALDFGFLNNRISGTLEYYSMSTHDMIMNQRLPSFTGFTNITTNLGQVDNRGFEISLNTLNIDRENLKWTTTFGFSYNKNEIKHLYYQHENILDADGNIVGSKERDDISNGWFIGKPIGAIWNYRVTGIWQANEFDQAQEYGQYPGDPKVANNYTADDVTNPDGSIKHTYNDKDKEFLGETNPPIHWSLRNEFVLWKDLSIAFNIYSYMGHKSLSGEYLNNDDDGGRLSYGMANLPQKEYWTPENPTNRYGRIQAKGPTGAEGAQMLYDRSFIRLDNISVGYTLPRKWTSRLELERVKLYGSIRNVAVWSKDWEYGDPETGGMATRIFSLGLNLTF